MAIIRLAAWSDYTTDEEYRDDLLRQGVPIEGIDEAVEDHHQATVGP